MLKNKSALISWGKFLIGWPISFVSIVFIVKLVIDKGSELNLSASNIDKAYLFLGISTFFLYFLMRSFLWQLELKEKGYKINFRENTYRFAFSELKRYTPGNVWSFLSRAHQFGELGVDKKTIGVSILADIQLVVIGSVLVSIFSIPWMLNPGTLQTQLASLLPLSLVAIIIYFFATGLIYKKRFQQNESLTSSFFLPGFSPNSKIKLCAVSTLTYFIFGVANYFVFISIFPENLSSFLVLSSFFVFSLLMGYLSFITPMGLGVREIIVTLGLTSIVGLSSAGTISIFTRVILVLSELIFLALIFLWEKSYQKI